MLTVSETINHGHYNLIPEDLYNFFYLWGVHFI